MPDLLLLLLVHAVMLDTGFVGASEVTARLSHVAMPSVLAESGLPTFHLAGSSISMLCRTPQTRQLCLSLSGSQPQPVSLRTA